MIITDSYLPGNKYCAFSSDKEDKTYKKWPDEKGVTPRDMSIGYYDHKMHGRLHVFPTELLKDKLNKK